MAEGVISAPSARIDTKGANMPQERRWCEVCGKAAYVANPRAKVKWYIVDAMGVIVEMSLCDADAADLRNQGISVEKVQK